MEIRATTDDPPDTGADTVVVGVFDGKGVPHDVEDGALGALVESGEARSAFRKLAAHPRRGPALDPDRARRARRLRRRARPDRGRHRARPRARARHPHALLGAAAQGRRRRRRRARRGHAAGRVPLPRSSRASRARIVRPTRWSSPPITTSPRPSRRGRAGAEAANRARDLGNAPANTLTPEALAARARELDGVQVEVMGRAEIEAAGMGAFAAIAQGSDREPQLITIRHEPAGRGRPAARARRQGGHVRHRRLLDQARRAHARDEVRHVRRRGRARGDGRDRAARAAGPDRQRDRRDREHGLRARRAAGRHRALEVRDHDRVQQHRRRGPAGARRLPHPRARPGRRAPARPRDADRRDRDDVRVRPRGPDGQRRRLVRHRHGGRRVDRRARLAAAAGSALRRADQGPLRRHLEPPARPARRCRSRPPRSCTASRATCRGRTSTSRGSPTTSGGPTRARARRAGACGCWSSSPAPPVL